MMAFSHGERAHEPTQSIIVGEEMTNCGHCGGRTELEEQYDDGSRLERCLGCGQRYHVEDEIEGECMYRIEPEEADLIRSLLLTYLDRTPSSERLSEIALLIEALPPLPLRDWTPPPAAEAAPDANTADTNPDFGMF